MAFPNVFTKAIHSMLVAPKDRVRGGHIRCVKDNFRSRRNALGGLVGRLTKGRIGFYFPLTYSRGKELPVQMRRPSADRRGQGASFPREFLIN